MTSKLKRKLHAVDDSGRPEGAILKYDRFQHRRLVRTATIEYVSVDGAVGYRIRFERHIRHSSRRNFLRNWKPYENES